MKICCQCKEEKEEKEFWKATSTRDRLQTACRGCQAKTNQKWTKENPIRRAWISLAKGAKQRGIAFRLSFIEFETLLLSEQFCPVCDREFPEIGKGLSGADNLRSVDRLDPLRCYEESNCSLICLRCNRTKQDSTPAQLRRLADWIDGQLNARAQVLVEQLLANSAAGIVPTV